MESFLNTVSKLIRENQLPALMIGGHAVTALGHPRATYDLDLLIPRSSAQAWGTALWELGFRTYAETPNFLQFEANASLPLPPVDLMLVDDDVFESLSSTKNNSSPIPTPAVEAMIALKLHAINQPSRKNTTQDWNDVFALIQANNLSLDDPGFSAIVSKHGGAAATERIRSEVPGGN
jgi:hypothetical protein